ncbi:hypothetical protein MPTK1_4g11510 [Marchantia polymorpha subsp. ruderalis]|uniref:Uncharacterized protein n=2 Tax=Marchantia polymorpha TaxID=3197 RepID=A0AAF6B8U4_MARPO|nr:hypothetical protein MARPO_0011s0136 [Marchantia polymorpha]BBN08428.1 hypothetical protein Mp_4g11510 [Marchantia polymorpha subsp. ruderalis]|eukprot:PTQ46464.1 hypothetical protein MARPO_0011s0136 [Marchantia polymorpha]
MRSFSPHFYFQPQLSVRALFPDLFRTTRSYVRQCQDYGGCTDRVGARLPHPCPPRSHHADSRPPRIQDVIQNLNGSFRIRAGSEPLCAFERPPPDLTQPGTGRLCFRRSQPPLPPRNLGGFRGFRGKGIR